MHGREGRHGSAGSKRKSCCRTSPSHCARVRHRSQGGSRAERRAGPGDGARASWIANPAAGPRPKTRTTAEGPSRVCREAGSVACTYRRRGQCARVAEAIVLNEASEHGADVCSSVSPRSSPKPSREDGGTAITVAVKAFLASVVACSSSRSPEVLEVLEKMFDHGRCHLSLLQPLHRHANSRS